MKRSSFALKPSTGREGHGETEATFGRIRQVCFRLALERVWLLGSSGVPLVKFLYSCADLLVMVRPVSDH